MKTTTVFTLLALSVIIAVVLYYNKSKAEHSEIDDISLALTPARHIIGPGSSIAFSGPADKLELFVWSRYALVPAYIYNTDSYTDTDTLLAIRYNAADTLTNRRIIWQLRDKLYHYTISVKP